MPLKKYAWIAALGSDYEEIHETWLHRLANLTLTAYNSKYSNEPFERKRDMDKGFRQSGLRLNTWVANQDKWTIEELEKRSGEMISRGLTIWALPVSDFQPAEKQLDSFSLEDEVDFSGLEIAKFSYKNVEQPVDSWITMFEIVVKTLHNDDKSILTKLAHTDSDIDDLSVYVSSNPANLRSSLEIDQNIYFERNTSTNTKVSLLRKLFNAYGQDHGNLIFYLKRQDSTKNEDEEGTRYTYFRVYAFLNAVA